MDINKKTLIKIMPLSVLALGILDVVLRIGLAGTIGFEGFLNDPGKHFFHIVSAPLAVYLLIKHADPEVYQRFFANPTYRLLTILMSAAVAVVLTLFIVNDTVESYVGEKEYVSPSELKQDYRAPLIAYLKEKGSWTDMDAAARDLYRQDYKEEFYAPLRGAGFIDEKDTLLVSKYQLFFEVASVRKYLQGLLSFLGACIPLVLFLHGGILLFCRTKPPSKPKPGTTWQQPPKERKMQNSILASLFLLVPWIFLTTYSKWYSSFGGVINPGAIIVAIGMASVLLLLCIFVANSKVGAILLGGISSVGSVVGFVFHKDLDKYFVHITGLSPEFKIAAYTPFILLFVVLSLWFAENGWPDEGK